MNENERNERIVCEFLRKIAPLRKWEYLGEVEHYWISQLCDELNKQLKANNAKLRELMRDMFDGMCRRGPDCRGCEHYELHEGQRFVGECEYHRRMREFGIEVK